ncbi:MAG: deoxynucleoside kinase [Clostridia bacterium]|nr:deoxynucleoside kinase [Clostridia bacterium]MBQ8398393.1 deoxynucleoside kinase [Clostridia bacterium]
MSKLLVIDGLDGSGKGSITRMLRDYLTEKGVDNDLISFPMYDLESSSLVKLYLSGALGSDPADTGSYAASTLFAADRYVSYRTHWHTLYEKEGSVLIADRYTTANAVHQLTKLPEEQWDDFLDWLFDFEYGKLGLPTPDHVFYLEMPPHLCRKMIAKRAGETGRTVDIHEKDSDHLDKAYKAALYAGEKLGWTRLKSFEGEDVRPLEDILKELLDYLDL